MKILNLITAAATISMLACQLVSAQKIPNRFPTKPGKIVTEAEFNKLKYNARLKLESQRHRTRTVEEIFFGSKTVPDQVKSTVEESAPPDKFREVEEIKTSEGGISKTGFMRIGKDRYQIDSSGKWMPDADSGYGRGSGMGNGNGKTPPPQIYQFIGKSILEGKRTFVYEVSGKHDSHFGEQSAESDEQTRYWFSEDGRLLRREGTENYTALNRRVKKLIINQYDVDIRILKPTQPKTIKVSR
jgi:hypothetical protein